MGPDVLTDPGEVPLDVEEQIDRICVRFEQRWQAGPGPALRPLLAEIADNWQPALFRELVKVELDYRLAHRENPRLDEYVESYPEFADLVRTVFPAPARTLAEWPSRPIPRGPVDRAAAAPQRVGNYRIIRELGRGGMGVVYKAIQASLDRQVALKVLAPLRSTDTEVQRFRREAEVASRLHHTNIVPIFEAGQDGDIRYYAMQYIPGHDLHWFIKRARREHGEDLAQARSAPTDSTCAEVGRCACSPLTGGLPQAIAFEQSLRLSPAAATTAGRRRDGRPGSFSPGGRDGRAGRLGPGVRPRPGSRPPRHQAHQPLAGLARDRLDHRFRARKDQRQRSDQRRRHCRNAPVPASRAPARRLRRSLRYLLAGPDALRAGDPAAAFPEPDQIDLLEAIHNREPRGAAVARPADPSRPGNDHRQGQPEKSPCDRYQRATDLAEDLRRFLAGEPTLARRIGPVERAWIWSRRRPWTALGLTLFCGALVLVAVMSIMFARAARRHAAELNQALTAVRKSEATARAIRPVWPGARNRRHYRPRANPAAWPPGWPWPMPCLLRRKAPSSARSSRCCGRSRSIRPRPTKNRFAG